MLKKICEELGVKIGEEWQNNMGDTYKIMEDGLFYKWTTDDWVECGGHDYRMLLTKELKPVWEPKEDEIYYIPHLHAGAATRARWTVWDNDNDDDQWYFENNMVFKTKEEAIEAANRLIELYKEDK